MGEKPMAPNSPTSEGNQSETVSASGVEHGAEAKGNRPAMTDEERARAMVIDALSAQSGREEMPVIYDDEQWAVEAVKHAIAHEREECAKEAGGLHIRHSINDKLSDAAIYNRAVSDISTAIRARGGKI